MFLMVLHVASSTEERRGLRSKIEYYLREQYTEETSRSGVAANSHKNSSVVLAGDQSYFLKDGSCDKKADACSSWVCFCFSDASKISSAYLVSGLWIISIVLGTPLSPFL